MPSRLMTAIPVVALLLVAPVAVAETVIFEMIPHAVGANDMSPDGRYIVGEADWNGDGWADGSYLLDTVTGTMTDLGNVVDPTTSIPAVAVSDDGGVVLGNMPDPNDPNGGSVGNVAAIWRASTGEWESLGYLPNAGYCPSRSSGYELSADGSVAVGLSWDGCIAVAIVWTEATGMLPLEELANRNNRASVISADGTLIGGFAQGSFSRTPAIWDAVTRDGELMDPPNGDALGEIHGVSDDGTILLGTWTDGDPPSPQAVKWLSGPSEWQRELVGSGSLLPGWQGIPMDIADNGTIVGFDFLVGYRRAWIQPGGSGPLVELEAYIEANGGTVPPDLALEVCQAISSDGRYIVGHGYGTGAWRVTIVPCPGDIDHDLDVDLSDLAQLLANYGVTSGAAYEDGDLDGDGDVDLSDLAALLSAYGTTCS